MAKRLSKAMRVGGEGRVAGLWAGRQWRGGWEGRAEGAAVDGWSGGEAGVAGMRTMGALETRAVGAGAMGWCATQHIEVRRAESELESCGRVDARVGLTNRVMTTRYGRCDYHMRRC